MESNPGFYTLFFFLVGSQVEADFSVLSSSKHKGHLSADSQVDFDQVKRKEKPKEKGQKIVVF